MALPDRPGCGIFYYGFVWQSLRGPLPEPTTLLIRSLTTARDLSFERAKSEGGGK